VKPLFPQWRLFLGKLRTLIGICCTIICRHPFVVVIFIIILIVIGFYYVNFQYLPERNEVWWPFFQYLSEKNEDWGTFGDYVGGILNPVIASFAFYLIAKTYELQKRELEATRSLLEVSTNAQKDQIKLAALTALLNSNLMRIDMLKSEKNSLLQVMSMSMESKSFVTRLSAEHVFRKGEIEDEINSLTEKNNKLEEQIEGFWKEEME